MPFKKNETTPSPSADLIGNLTRLEGAAARPTTDYTRQMPVELDPTSDFIISLGDIAMQAKLPHRPITKAEFDRLNRGIDSLREMLEERVTGGQSDD